MDEAIAYVKRIFEDEGFTRNQFYYEEPFGFALDEELGLWIADPYGNAIEVTGEPDMEVVWDD